MRKNTISMKFDLGISSCFHITWLQWVRSCHFTVYIYSCQGSASVCAFLYVKLCRSVCSCACVYDLGGKKWSQCDVSLSQMEFSKWWSPSYIECVHAHMHVLPGGAERCKNVWNIEGGSYGNMTTWGNDDRKCDVWKTLAVWYLVKPEWGYAI